jgi:hypothetical protein
VLGAAALGFAGIFAIVIIAAVADPVSALLEDRQLAKAFDQLVQVGAAIERYRVDKGRYPGALDDLVPSYLKELPRDPYSNSKEPPHYETAPSHRLWSVGPNEKDDGGDERDDLVYAVEPLSGS